ncbi:MAG: hypothetical protein V1804_02195 [Patescibacteria group bacterium]
MRFLGIKQGGTTMDASKKGTEKKQEEEKNREAKKKKLEEGENFIWDGRWPGEKVVLAPENWEEIIKRFLYRTEDVFKNLYDFTTIRSLVNRVEMKCLHVTDQNILDLGEGLSLETHCSQVRNLSHSFNEISKLELYRIEKNLLITRKQEWIVWNSEGIRTQLKKSKEEDPGARILYKVSSFKKIDSILPFLKSGETRGESIMDHFFLMLDSDVSEQERRLSRKKQARDLAKEIYERARSLRVDHS